MKAADAIEICEGWFAYIERQKQWSAQMQRLATLARTQPELAQRGLRQLDNCSVTVYDGARLEPAVRLLVKLARDGSLNGESR